MKTGTIIALLLGTVVVGGAGVGAAVLLTREGGDQKTLGDANDGESEARIAEAEAAAEIARSQADAAKAQADAAKAQAKAADKPFWEIAIVETIKGASEFAKSAW